MTDLVLTDRPAPHVARILINRPDKRNAIDAATRQALIEQVTALLADVDVRALVLGGAGGHFSAGGDVATMAGIDEAAALARMQHGHQLCRLVGNAGVPVVSAIEGVGVGAAVGLALLGDRIVAGEGARIMFPFLKLGLTPDWGLLLSLPRRVGLPVARRILDAGLAIAGAEAQRIGLVDEVVPDDQVMPRAIALASQLAMLPRQAYAMTKARLNQPSVTLGEELEREARDQVRCLVGDEFREGLDAHQNKRNADFSRRLGSERSTD
jgi:2-(1,2-epoxy-1,2-dihydrophenyl)acetyl-CoA isomerase